MSALIVTREYPFDEGPDSQDVVEDGLPEGATIEWHLQPYSGEGTFEVTAPADTLDVWEAQNGYV